MATRVSGPLHTITDYAPHVASVWVRPASPRPYDGGLILGAQVPADFSNGTVSFTAKPGPGVLLLQGYNGPPETHPILVGENPSATLEEVVRAADLAGDEDVASLARMVAQVQDAYAAANDVHRSLEFLATRAEDASQTAVDAAEEAVAAATVVEIIDLHQYTGTGFPEGKVTAPVGATYTDTAATNGAVRWIKTSGTGNTGWKVEYGDTGWRDITSSIENRMSPLEFTDGAKLLVRRIGDLAYLKISGRVYVRSEFGRLCDNFTGFRPEGYAQANFSKAADINVGVWQIRVESGTVGGALTSGADRSVMGYWDVASSWPSTLPGIPS